MAAEKVGGATLSSLLNAFFERLASREVTDLFREKKPIADLLEKLKSMLWSASSVLNDAEDKKTRDDDVKNWVDVLKEVLCEANDAMDKIYSEALQREVEGRHPSRSSTSKLLVKDNPSFFNTFDKEIKPKIANTLERLKCLLDQKYHLGLRAGVQSKRMERSPTRFIKNPRIFYGKDGKKEASSDDNMDSYGKDLNPNPNHVRLSPASHRSFYKSDIRKGLLSSPSSASSGRYDWDRTVDDDRESSRMVRKRPGHDFDGFDRRNGYDRYGGGGGSESRGYDQNTMHRSKSFCGPRREFPKGFRSERDRPRQEVSASSWRRFGSGGKDLDERGKALRDTRSPSWSNSRDSGSEQYRIRSPSKGYRDGRSTSVSTSILKSKSKSKSMSKSPTWSRDSVGSEQSKCIEVKKSEDPPAEKGSSSEMEEGELEPEPQPKIPESQPVTEPESKSKPDSVAEAEFEKGEVSVHSERDVDDKEVESERRVEEVNIVVDNENNETKPAIKKGVCEEKNEEDHEVDRSLNVVEKSASEESNKDESPDEVGESPGIESEKGKEVIEEQSLQSDVKHEEENGIDLEDKVENVKEKESEQEITEENRLPEEDTEKPTMEDLAQSFKDKGKSVALTPTHIQENAPSDGHWIDRDTRDTTTCRDNDMEGPTTRGFELFGNSPVRKPEKEEKSGANTQKDKNLGFELLDLTLSLPNVLLPIGAAPGSPAQSLSNTFRTTSDGFTASMSFSGSQSLYHNPSCSLTQTSLDNMEQSVKSRPIFQGIDWQALSQNEPKGKDFPLYQRLTANGNGSQSHQQSHPNMNGQSSQAQNPKPKQGLERQLSFHNDAKSPSHSVGSHDIGSNYSFDRKRLMRKEKSNGSLYRSGSSKMENDPFPSGEAEFVEAIAGRIVSEPIESMASKFNEMTIPSLACLKDSIRDMITNADKRRQISALQKLLQDRSDTITLETLQKSHRAQLEILVAIKTALPDFLPQDLSVSSSDLAEIFMNLRCKNVACRSHVPVDECDCKVCGQKNGFCSSCMCLVCSKFDMASNTCSWVGCDVCLHWCHTDCGLRESFIRNGRSASGSHGASEMQFHCVACDHPSEMFGFVKEVFLNFAKEWTAETLSKELEYVKRIFAASKDFRGKKLHEIAGQMMARLTKKADLLDVYNFIIAFLNDSDSFKLSNTPLSSVKEQSKPSNGIAGPSQEQPSWLKSVYPEKIQVPQLELPSSLLPSYNYDRNDKQIVALELQTSTQNEPLFDEIESIVRIKVAEAKMFQSRADDARREAEGLQRIAITKNEKIGEEYNNKIVKLRLVEAEQIRKQKFDELQALERSHREYFNMKMRMEAEIKDLLVKMEATKRNLAA